MAGRIFGGMMISLVASIGLSLTLAMAGPGVSLLSPSGTFLDPNGTYGYAFSVRNDETIDALGAYDDGQDGLTGRAMVGIWDSEGDLLASTFIPAGAAGVLIGDFRYNGIAPLTLTPTETYLVASYQPDDLITSFNVSVNGEATLDANVVSVYDWYSTGSGFVMPDQTNYFAGAYLGGNFTDQMVPVLPDPLPEPASLAVLSTGLMAVLSTRRRKALWPK